MERLVFFLRDCLEVRVETDLTIFNIPVAILVGSDAGEGEVDFGVFDLPPAHAVLEDTILIEEDFAVGRLPPAETVLVDLVRFEVHFTGLDTPPSIIVLVDAGSLKVHFSVFDAPPAKVVGCHTGVVHLGALCVDCDPVFAGFLDGESFTAFDGGEGGCRRFHDVRTGNHDPHRDHGDDQPDQRIPYGFPIRCHQAAPLSEFCLCVCVYVHCVFAA